MEVTGSLSTWEANSGTSPVNKQRKLKVEKLKLYSLKEKIKEKKLISRTLGKINSFEKKKSRQETFGAFQY